MGQSPGPSPPPQMSPMYGRSPQDYNDSPSKTGFYVYQSDSKLFTTLPDPEYWSRLAEYSPSPNSQVQRIMCPSMRTPPPGE